MEDIGFGTIKAEFANFMQACHGPDWWSTVPPRQVEEKRLAFQAGGIYVFSRVLKLSFLPAGLQEAGLATLRDELAVTLKVRPPRDNKGKHAPPAPPSGN